MKEALTGIAAYIQETGGPESKADEALAACVNADGSFDAEKFQKTITSVLDGARNGFKTKLKTIEDEVGKKAGKAFDAKEQAMRQSILDKYEDEFGSALGIEGGLRGDAFRDAVKAKLTAPKQGKGDMTEGDIEKSKFYQDALVSWKNSTADAVKKVRDEFDAYKTNVQTEKVRAEVLKRATPIIERLNPKFDEDSETVRANQWENLNRLIVEGRQFDVQGDRVVVLDAEGHVAKDDSKNPIEFAALVARIVKDNIGVRAADKRGGTGQQSQHQKPTTVEGWKGDWPKSEAEYQALRADRRIPLEERRALEKAWEEKRKNAA